MRLSTLFEPNYKSACAIVMDDSGKLLMGRSAHGDSRRGKWCFPGGHLDGNEPPEKGAERECKEETGITCKAVQTAMPNRSEPSVAFVVCQKVSGKEMPNHEFSELNWFDKDEAMNLPDLYPPNIEILKTI